MTGKPFLTIALLLVVLALGYLSIREYSRMDEENTALRQEITALKRDLEAAKAAQAKQKERYRRLVQDFLRQDLPRAEIFPEDQEPFAGGITQESGRILEGKAEMTVSLDFEALKTIWQEGKQPEIVTPESIELTLSRHARDTEFLVVAAMFTEDLTKALAYLEEALKKSPESAPALSEWIIRSIEAGDRGNFILWRIEELKRVSATNSLPHYYAAYWYLQNGNAAGFLVELREGSSKNYFNDYMATYVPIRQTFYREAGASDSVSEILSAVSPHFKATTLMGTIGNRAVFAIRELYEAEAFEDALSVCEDVIHLGNKLSASSRYFLQDLVGMEIQEVVLQEEMLIHTELENLERVAQIDRQLLYNDERIEKARRTAARLREKIRELNEKDLLEYARRVLSEGELFASADLLK